MCCALTPAQVHTSHVWPHTDTCANSCTGQLVLFLLCRRHTRAHMLAHTQTHTHTHARAHAHAHTHAHVHARTHTHTHKHARRHAQHTHTHTNTRSRNHTRSDTRTRTHLKQLFGFDLPQGASLTHSKKCIPPHTAASLAFGRWDRERGRDRNRNSRHPWRMRRGTRWCSR